MMTSVSKRTFRSFLFSLILLPLVACQQVDQPPQSNPDVKKQVEPTPSPSPSPSASPLPTPSPSPQPGDGVEVSQLVNPTNSKIIKDPKNVNRFYVLPPEKDLGLAKHRPVPNANLGFCESIGYVQKTSQKYLKNIEEQKIEMSVISQDLETIHECMSSTQEKIDQLKPDLPSIENCNQILNKIIFYEKWRKDKEEARRQCSTDKCTAQADTIIRIINSELKNKIDEKTKSCTPIQDKVKEYNELVQLLDQYRIDEKSKKEKFESIEKQKKSNLELFKSLNQAYESIQGGEFDLEINSNWLSNLNQIIEKNSKTLQFAIAPISQVRVTIEVIDGKEDSIFPGLKNVLSFNVLGQSDKTGLFERFPKQLYVSVDLNLLGACPLIYPDYFKVEPRNENQNNVQATYQYHLDLN